MNISKHSRLLLNVLSGLIIAGALYFVGYTVGHQNLVFEKGFKPTVANTELGKPKNVDFALFWEVWNKVRGQFAGQIKGQEMVYDAINGALSSLDDPYTLFLPPDEAKRFNDDLKGSFDGIGAEIEKRNGNLTIVSPLEDSPAQQAGLRGQDIIVKIDDTETFDLSLDSAIDKIRGKKGTQVLLTIAREGTRKPLELRVTRDTIVVKSVKWEVKDDGIGYLKLNIFGEDTVKLTQEALASLKEKKIKGLVVDVRNNPGGLLDVSVDVSSLFLNERGAIVKEEDKDGKISDLPATLEPQFADKPLVILANGGSASASEIFAGALQDYDRAKLIGEKTFGKGSVQVLEKVSGGAAVRITIAKWLTPKNRQINKLGISPDIEVLMSDEDLKEKRDPQLDKALETLRTQIGG